MAQTASPDMGRSLGNLYFDLCDEYFRLEAAVDLSSVGGLEEKGQRLHEVLACLFDRFALAGYVIFRG